MTKYIKQEMIDLNGIGKNQCFYRIDLKGSISSKDLIEQIAHPGSGLSKGTVMHVLQTLVYELSITLSKGYSVNIEGLGNFRARLGVKKEKPMDTLDDDEQKRNATNIIINGINFRADKHLVFQTNNHCRLSRGTAHRLYKSPYTKEERLKLALSYLSNPKTPFMRQADYQAMTELSRSKAHEDLVEFRNNPESGIIHSGIGNNIVYIKKCF